MAPKIVKFYENHKSTDSSSVNTKQYQYIPPPHTHISKHINNQNTTQGEKNLKSDQRRKTQLLAMKIRMTGNIRNYARVVKHHLLKCQRKSLLEFYIQWRHPSMFQKSPGFVTENSPMVGLHQEAWQRLTGLAPGYSHVSFQLEDKQLSGMMGQERIWEMIDMLFILTMVMAAQLCICQISLNSTLERGEFN